MTVVLNKIAGLRHTGRTPTSRPTSWRDINIRPISEEWRTAKFGERQPAYRSAVANVAYIWRMRDVVDEIGPMPMAFGERRFEVVSSGLLLPGTAPLWAMHGYQLWEEADSAARHSGDPTEVRAWHVIMALPCMLRPFWKEVVTGFAERELVSKGAAVAYAIHACEDADGNWLVEPHCHMIVSARHWRHDRRFGRRHPAWLARRSQHEAIKRKWRETIQYLSGAG